MAFFGRFQSLTLSVRDATETYLELGQRIPIYLNGEIQIAWVLEQGLVDMAFVVRTFGVKNIRRDQLVSRGPRFHIAFDANAAGRANQTSQEKVGSEGAALRGGVNVRDIGGNLGLFSGSGLDGGDSILDKPASDGRYEMMRCKVDSLSLGLMPGRRVAAVRWEGVSEGISYVGQSLQQFKENAVVNRADFSAFTTAQSAAPQ